ncbi:MAG: 16S rRNA (cytidine(1402)-2'-O)-methyltransferase [Candidatus Cloacimonetes bacterium]|nr:16S rRNA (cytidine(1402)-2'-O)-methyltransferase [Candidatus Cloacimonadota bacterium]
MQKGKLYLIPTPIGNLKDITLRALEILRTVAVIGSEDTRNSGYLLKHYGIDTPLVSYHKFNERKRSSEFLQRLINGEDIALISDAGSPGISDPAAEIIKQAIESGIQIDALPGATALIPALTGSGLNTDHFYFIGFLPEKKKDKTEILQRLESCPDTLIFYVSPHDLYCLAADLYKSFGDRSICLARELTKIYEEYIRTSLKEIVDKAVEITLKGEFVAIVEGKKVLEITDEELMEKLDALKDKDLSNKEIILKISSQEHISPNRIKKLLY